MEDRELEEAQKDLSENLDMVNYIMLHRIYDVLTIIAKHMAGADEVKKMLDYHNDGFLLGPAPSFTPQDTEENS